PMPPPMCASSLCGRCMLARLSFRVLFLLLGPPPRSSLFPYTTLFRSLGAVMDADSPEARSRSAVAERAWAEDAPSGGGRSRSATDRKSTRLNSSHVSISYAVFCLKKKRVHPACHSQHHAPPSPPFVAH